MYVVNRKGDKIPVRYDEITERNTQLSRDLNIDTASLSQSIIKGLRSGMTTCQIDELACETAVFKYAYEPDYATLASRICISDLHKKTPKTFLEAMTLARQHNLITQDVYDIVVKYNVELERVIDHSKDYNYSYFGYKTLLNSYLLAIKEKNDKIIIERPQYMLMRVCIGIHGDDLDSIIESYRSMSNMEFTHATPTLFNAGTERNQLASCFLMTCGDSVDDITRCLSEAANISKYAGGIGIDITPIRGKGSHIKGTNGTSNGIIPFARVFQAVAKAIDQGGGKRPGAIQISLQVWHPDVMQFLDLKIQEKGEDFRTLDLHTSVWVPDIFWKRLELAIQSDSQESIMWSMFQPNEYPELITMYGDEFEARYLQLETDKKYFTQIPIVKLWKAVTKSLESAGEPYVLSKDNVNRQNMQMNIGAITSTNLCCEIMEYHDKDSIAVCNLASISLSSCVEDGRFNFDKLGRITRIITRNLNKIIDRSFYPIPSARDNNFSNRPIGIGVQGLADVFAMLKLPWESQGAEELNKAIFEEMYYNALQESCNLSKIHGPYANFANSPISKGLFHFDLFPRESLTLRKDWDSLRRDIMSYGVRNSLLIAPMPTASTAQILGNNEAFEPFTSNIYVRKTNAGYHQIINKYLYRDLLPLNLWTKDIVDEIIQNEGSIQSIDKIPTYIKDIYKTSWEIPSKVIINFAGDRQAFVDQSQSMNIFMKRPTLSMLTSMYIYAWKRGLKTLSYYVRSQPSTGAVKFSLDAKVEDKKERKVVCTDEVCTMCSS